MGFPKGMRLERRTTQLSICTQFRILGVSEAISNLPPPWKRYSGPRRKRTLAHTEYHFFRQISGVIVASK